MTTGLSGLSTVLLAVALTVAGVLAGAFVVLVWRQRPRAGSSVLSGVAAIACLWSFGQLMMVLGGSGQLRIAGLYLSVAPLAFISVALFVFALQYTGQDGVLSKPVVAALLVEPVVFVALLATHGFHTLVAVDPVSFAGGTGYLLHTGYQYALLAVANWILFRKFLASRNVYRTRTLVLLLVNVLPTVGHVLSTVGVSPLPYTSLGPVMFVGIGVVGVLAIISDRAIAAVPLDRALGLFSGRSQSLAPMARDTAIEQLHSGFVVLDHRNRVVDINPSGRQMLGKDDGRIIGKDLGSILAREVFEDDNPPFFDADATGEYRGVWVQPPDGERRCFDLTVTAIESGESYAGRVALIHDVTDRERRKQKLEARTDELERQNEQLESFANIVSHDLRNPINVADGRLDLIETEDTEHKRVARRALARMETLIDDVLAMATLGRTVDEIEPVGLSAVAADAWETVESPTGTLEVTPDRHVAADRNRLRQLFENLFRNSVEHADGGSGPLTVTVGATADGFFVADDGPGIPPDIRDRVFEEGVTTNDEGTGFGLSIVETIAEAHGWTVTATESESGGARFEFGGVEDARPAKLRTPEQV